MLTSVSRPCIAMSVQVEKVHHGKRPANICGEQSKSSRDTVRWESTEKYPFKHCLSPSTILNRTLFNENQQQMSFYATLILRETSHRIGAEIGAVSVHLQYPWSRIRHRTVLMADDRSRASLSSVHHVPRAVNCADWRLYTRPARDTVAHDSTAARCQLRQHAVLRSRWGSNASVDWSLAVDEVCCSWTVNDQLPQQHSNFDLLRISHSNYREKINSDNAVLKFWSLVCIAFHLLRIAFFLHLPSLPLFRIYTLL